MMKKPKPYRGKSFYRLLAAFFFVTLLCSILMLTQYLNSAHRAQVEEKRSYQSMVQKSINNTANTLSHYEQTSALIARLDGLDALANAEEIPVDSAGAADFLNSYMQTIRISLPATEQPMYLYFEKSGRTLGRAPGNDPLEDGVITGLFGINIETWEQLIQTGEQGICTIVRDPNMDFARYMYVRQIYPGGVWMIGMEDGQISENLSYYYLPEGAQTIFITQNGRMISSDPDGNTAGLPLTFEQVGSWDAFSTQAWDGVTYYVYHQPFTNGSLEQVIVIPVTGSEERLAMILTAIFTTLAVTLVLGGAFSYFFATTLYRPVEKMVDALPEKRRPPKKGGSEFQMVANTMQALAEQAKTYEAQLNSQSELLMTSLLTRLLKGEIGMTPDISEALREGGFPVACERYLVFILLIDEEAEAEAPATMTQEAAGSLLKETCRSFFLNGGFASYVVTDKDLFVGVVDLDGGAEEDVEACAKNIQSFTASELHIQISMALSGIHSEIGELHEAFREAMEVVEYHLLAGEYGEVDAYSHLSNLIAANTGSREFLSKANKLSNSIQSGNFTQASALLREIGEDHARKPASLPQAQLQLSYLTDAILLSLLDSGADPELLKSLHASDILLQARSMDSLCRRARDILDRLGQLKEQNRPQERRIEQITQYIEDNYADVNLSAGAVAEHFHMSLPVLSNLFKQELNVGFLDYLHKYRIERAKELIINTGHTIGDISAMVGYANSITMNRAFKRYEGVTPGWYRQAGQTESAPPGRAAGSKRGEDK